MNIFSSPTVLIGMRLVGRENGKALFISAIEVFFFVKGLGSFLLLSSIFSAEKSFLILTSQALDVGCWWCMVVLSCLVEAIYAAFNWRWMWFPLRLHHAREISGAMSCCRSPWVCSTPHCDCCVRFLMGWFQQQCQLPGGTHNGCRRMVSCLSLISSPWRFLERTA